MNAIFYRGFSSATASITKVRRVTYTRKYPVLLVFPDGSTINTRYHEPRRIITLPLDINILNEEEKKIRLRKRRPVEKVQKTEEIKHTFDPTKYTRKIINKK